MEKKIKEPIFVSFLHFKKKGGMILKGGIKLVFNSKAQSIPPVLTHLPIVCKKNHKNLNQAKVGNTLVDVVHMVTRCGGEN